MTDHRVTVETAGRTATVRFDRADRANCFTAPALDDLVVALEAAAATPPVSVVRLEMAGRHFCAGWDTREFGRLADGSAAEIEAALAVNDDRLDRIRHLPVPVVAAVRGRVAGFGAGLLASLHLPVAADDASLTLPEVGFGISPAGVLHALLQRLPRTAVNLLVLSGDVADADDLLRWGLVATVRPAELLDGEVTRLVDRLAAHPGDVVRTIAAATRAVAEQGTAAAAYAAAAHSILHGQREETS